MYDALVTFPNKLTFFFNSIFQNGRHKTKLKEYFQEIFSIIQTLTVLFISLFGTYDSSIDIAALV